MNIFTFFFHSFLKSEVLQYQKKDNLKISIPFQYEKIHSCLQYNSRDIPLNFDYFILCEWVFWLHVCVLCMFSVTAELWNDLWTIILVLGTEPGCSLRVTVLLNPGSFLQALQENVLKVQVASKTTQWVKLPAAKTEDLS